jgi:hypothetical protein
MWWASATACESVSPDPKIFFVVVMFRAAPNKLLALFWRERTRAEVVRLDFALTLALSREQERELNLF